MPAYDFHSAAPHAFPRVIGVGLHSETLEELVLYEKSDDFGNYKKGSLWVRPKKMWLEKVTVKGKKVPRFQFIRSE